MTVDNIYQFACTIPAGTAPSAPATFPLALPTGSPMWIEYRLPSGFNGQVGWWLGSHGQQILPFASGGPNWLIGNDEIGRWDLTGQMDSGDWQLVGYNNGANPHTVYLRFGMLLGGTSPGGASPLPSQAILQA